MFLGLIGNALDQITVAESLIEAHEDHIKNQPLDRQGQFRAYAVTSCVTRLYAVYEHFVESLISDFLDSLPELVPYASLSDGLKTEYRIGVSHVLSKIDHDRYDHLTHENVIRWYHEALTSNGTYRFVVEALTRHNHNLRLDVVDAMLSRVELRDFRGWVSNSREIRALYEEHASLFEQLSAEVRAFVQIRNDAAHGVLDDLQGKEVLLRHCALIRGLVRTIASFVHMNLLNKRANVGRMVKIGVVTEVFQKPGAFIAQILSGQEVRKGIPIHMVGFGYCSQQHVDSLQLDGVDVEIVISDRDNLEVGFKCASLPVKNSVIFIET